MGLADAMYFSFVSTKYTISVRIDFGTGAGLHGSICS
jgi:hypothetical protein